MLIGLLTRLLMTTPNTLKHFQKKCVRLLFTFKVQVVIWTTLKTKGMFNTKRVSHLSDFKHLPVFSETICNTNWTELLNILFTSKFCHFYYRLHHVSKEDTRQQCTCGAVYYSLHSPLNLSTPVKGKLYWQFSSTSWLSSQTRRSVNCTSGQLLTYCWEDETISW